MIPSRLSLARTIAAKSALDTSSDDLIECKLLLRELLARLDAAERVVTFARSDRDLAVKLGGPDPCDCEMCDALRAFDATVKPCEACRLENQIGDVMVTKPEHTCR